MKTIVEMQKPWTLPSGGTVGVFTPSTPAHTHFRSRFQTAIANIERLGFKVVLGRVTAEFKHQGYRTATGKERAEELNELFRNENVSLILSTIGGANSSSMLDYLDYEAIRESRKVFCGYSDVTSLHMAINTIAGLSTLYGPALVPSFGDSEGAAAETLLSFLHQSQDCWVGEFEAPRRWSNKGPSWIDSDGAPQSRQWNHNAGLRIVQDGLASGISLAANANTLASLAGTRYFPTFHGKILFIEEMNCPLSRFERNLTQLKLAGAFEGIKGIVLSKPEIYNSEGAPFDDCALLVEVLDNPSIPVIGNFDCGHTHPMLSVPQGIQFSVEAHKDRCSIRQMAPFALQCD